MYMDGIEQISNEMTKDTYACPTMRSRGKFCGRIIFRLLLCAILNI